MHTGAVFLCICIPVVRAGVRCRLIIVCFGNTVLHLIFPFLKFSPVMDGYCTCTSQPENNDDVDAPITNNNSSEATHNFNVLICRWFVLSWRFPFHEREKIGRSGNLFLSTLSVLPLPVFFIEFLIYTWDLCPA